MIDTVATSAAIEAALRALPDGPEASVAYDETGSVYRVTGLGPSAPVITLDTSNLTTDVTLSVAVTRELALTGLVGQQFRLQFGSVGAGSAPIELIDDGGGNVDGPSTAAAIQTALRALLGDSTLTVVFDAAAATYLIDGLSLMGLLKFFG